MSICGLDSTFRPHEKSRLRRLKLPPGDILIHAGALLVDGSSTEEIEDFDA
jgi:hypothetical protein